MWYILLVVVGQVAGHGRVLAPPSRASAWRFGFDTPPNYDDDGLNCGGFAVQYSTNGGKCGICGDAYNLAPPRPHELGGTYGKGVIVAQYQPGALVTITVQLSTSHKGFWEFKICPDPEINEQACFDKYILTLQDGGTKFYPIGSATYNITYALPKGLVCEHCVLQWRYTAGNNWGVCSNGTQGLGCGNQEQFGACSDIAIGPSKRVKTSNTVNDYGDIPYPLYYYLKNGFFDIQQGILHLIRNGIPPEQDKQKPEVKTKKPETKPKQRPSKKRPNSKHRPNSKQRPKSKKPKLKIHRGKIQPKHRVRTKTIKQTTYFTIPVLQRPLKAKNPNKIKYSKKKHGKRKKKLQHFWDTIP